MPTSVRRRRHCWWLELLALVIVSSADRRSSHHVWRTLLVKTIAYLGMGPTMRVPCELRGDETMTKAGDSKWLRNAARRRVALGGCDKDSVE